MDTTNAVTLATLPTTAPRHVRLAMLLQNDTAPLPSVPMDVDAALLPFMSDTLAASVPQTSAMSTARDGLTASAALACAGGQGQTVAVTFAPPMPGTVGRVEQVLWREIGVASVRACVWLYYWHKLRKFKAACEVCAINPASIKLWTDASITFRALYDNVDAAIKRYRLTETEDTLHALANGEIEGRKEALNRDGAVVSLSQGAIYSEKALAIALAAGNPTLYGAGKASGAGVSVSITVNAPYTVPAVHVERVIDADADVTDAEYVEA